MQGSRCFTGASKIVAIFALYIDYWGKGPGQIVVRALLISFVGFQITGFGKVRDGGFGFTQ